MLDSSGISEGAPDETRLRRVVLVKALSVMSERRRCDHLRDGAASAGLLGSAKLAVAAAAAGGCSSASGASERWQSSVHPSMGQPLNDRSAIERYPSRSACGRE